MQTGRRKKAAKPRKPAARLSKHGWKPNPVVQKFLKLLKDRPAPRAVGNPLRRVPAPYPILTKGPYTSNGPVA